MPAYPRLAIAIALDGRKKYAIAAAAGMCANYLGGFVSGRLAPSEEAQRRLADVLGVPVDELFTPGRGAAR